MNCDTAQSGAAFEEQYGVPVTVEEAGLDAINKIMLDGPAGNGADLFMVAHDSFQTVRRRQTAGIQKAS